MIHVKDDWYIEVDEYSYNLQQYNGIYVDKKGNEIKQWKNATYHPTLDKALWQYVQYRVRDALSENDVIEIKDAIQIVRSELKSARADIANITDGV